jgi:hypothetical protein
LASTAARTSTFQSPNHDEVGRVGDYQLRDAEGAARHRRAVAAVVDRADAGAQQLVHRYPADRAYVGGGVLGHRVGVVPAQRYDDLHVEAVHRRDELVNVAYHVVAGHQGAEGGGDAGTVGRLGQPGGDQPVAIVGDVAH